MKYKGFDKNVRFSYLLPYGFVAPAALSLSINMPGDAYELYTDTPMKDRLKQCQTATARRSDAINWMHLYGYISVSQRKYSGSSHWREIRVARLTKSGLYLLTSSDNLEEEYNRQSSIKEGLDNGDSYQDYSPDIYSLRVALNDYCKDKGNGQKEYTEFQKFFADVYNQLQLNPLASECILAESVSVSSNLNQYQIYRAWQIANIEALFKANGYLTSIDRPHISLARPKSLRYLQNRNRKIDVYDFTSAVLYKWYNDNPDAFTFLHGNPRSNDYITREEWAETPIFYRLNSVKGFNDVFFSSAQLDGSSKIINHISIGLAVGKEINYLVYHTSQSVKLWYPHTESYAAKAAQKALDDSSKDDCLGKHRSIEHAIMVCGSVHQFAALFNCADACANQSITRVFRVAAPYKGCYIIPINHSGVMQLRYLMSMHPAKAQQSIIYSLKHANHELKDWQKGIDERDVIFDLAYHGKPVFVGHLMDYQKIYWAKQYRKEGMDFIISCFPEQVKFYTKIMPGSTFL